MLAGFPEPTENLGIKSDYSIQILQQIINKQEDKHANKLHSAQLFQALWGNVSGLEGTVCICLVVQGDEVTQRHSVTMHPATLLGPPAKKLQCVCVCQGDWGGYI